MNKQPRESYNSAFSSSPDVEVTDSHVAHAGGVKEAIEGFQLSEDVKASTIFNFKGEKWTYNPATEQAEKVVIN